MPRNNLRLKKSSVRPKKVGGSSIRSKYKVWLKKEVESSERPKKGR